MKSLESRFGVFISVSCVICRLSILTLDRRDGPVCWRVSDCKILCHVCGLRKTQTENCMSCDGRVEML